MWNEEEASASAPGRASGGKGLFFALASLSLALLLFLLWLLFFLLEPRMAALGTGLISASRVVVVLVGLAAVAVVGSDFLSAGAGLRLIPGGWGHRVALLALLPASERLGRLVGVSSDRVKAGYIDFNNALLKARLERAGERGIPVPKAVGARRGTAGSGVPGTCCGWTGGCAEDGPAASQTDRGLGAVRTRTVGGILLLLPHCLQSSECTRELGEDVRNCGECGGCPMCELKKLVPRYGIQNRIVGGGTLALMAV
ncbi:MAG: DUF116 domain-containing protein, partial [Candidatus Eisenbacteria bacterium]|nr:DUF116 domain-containing protein [Candidatus Eisenbacteria bacterium]